MIVFEHAAPRPFFPRLDPRGRVLVVLAAAIVVCLCERWSALAAALLTGTVLLAASGLPLRRALQRLLPLNTLMLLLVLTLPLSVPGTPVAVLGPLHWSVEGLWHAMRIAARANAVMLLVTALLGTMEAPQLGFALDGLGMPSKFTHLLLFMIRYTEIIHHEYHYLRDAMRLRAFRPGTNRHTLRTFAYLIGQLLVRSVRRSERILEAMKCRGFTGRFYVLEHCRFQAADTCFVLAATAVLALVVILEVQ